MLLLVFIAALVPHMMEIKNYKGTLIGLHLSSTGPSLWGRIFRANLPVAGF